jgi:hypothetical protein
VLLEKREPVKVELCRSRDPERVFFVRHVFGDEGQSIRLKDELVKLSSEDQPPRVELGRLCISRPKLSTYSSNLAARLSLAQPDKINDPQSLLEDVQGMHDADMAPELLIQIQNADGASWEVELQKIQRALASKATYCVVEFGQSGSASHTVALVGCVRSDGWGTPHQLPVLDLKRAGGKKELRSLLYGCVQQYVSECKVQLTPDKVKAVKVKFEPLQTVLKTERTSEAHESQRIVGTLIHQSLVRMIRASEAVLQSKFKFFTFVIFVPNRNSLYEQTLARLRSTDLSEEPLVLKIQKELVKNKEFKKLKLAIANRKDTAFLLLIDEAHYGMGRKKSTKKEEEEGQSVDCENIDEKTLKARIFDDPDICEQRNVFELHISATPYNLECIRDRISEAFPEERVVKWSADGTVSWNGNVAQSVKGLGDASYIGIEDLVAQNQVTDDDLTATGKAIDIFRQSAQVRECIANAINYSEKAYKLAAVEPTVAFDYANGILSKEHQIRREPWRSLSRWQLHGHNTIAGLVDLVDRETGKGPMLALRLKDRDSATNMAKILSLARRLAGYSQLFEIILNISDDAQNTFNFDCGMSELSSTFKEYFLPR